MTISGDYKNALLDRHERSEWGVTGGVLSGESVVNFLREHPEIETVLDYGCGEGTLRAYVEAQGIVKPWTMYDPGMRGLDEKPNGKFDLVITTDVLEHVEPHMTMAVLNELRGFTNKFLYNDIACYYTGRYFDSGPYIGQDLHINLMVPDEWAVKLASLEGMIRIVGKIYIVDDWKLRYLSIQEAR
jgi:hypothetical protein